MIILEIYMITCHGAVFPNEIIKVNFLRVALISVLIRTMYQVILFIKRMAAVLMKNNNHLDLWVPLAL